MTTKPATSSAEYAERTRDELKQLELHRSDCGAITLDTFVALPRAEQRRAWALASEADKRSLALQMIRRGNRGPSEETIALYLDLFEAKFGGSDLAIPATDDILAVVKDRYDLSRAYGDMLDAGQLDRVRINLHNGARLTWCVGDLLIQSVNNPGAVYSVNRRGCTCPNGRKGKSSCWHVALYDILLDMQEERAATADMAADRAADLGRRLARARAQLAA